MARGPRTEAKKRRKRTGSKRNGLLGRSLLLALTGAVALSVIFFGWIIIGYGQGLGRGRGVPVVIEIQPGSSPQTLAQRLYDAGVIENPLIFATYARLVAAGKTMRSGQVLFYKERSPHDALTRAYDGFGHVDVRVVIPEGFNRFQIADRLESAALCSAQDFIRATEDQALLEKYNIDANSVEGYLMPATYDLNQAVGVDAIADHMVRTFFATFPQFDDPNYRAQYGEQRWTAHQVLTLASVVEKEAAVADERADIAGVFVNRLLDDDFVPHRLDSDPTTKYGCRALKNKVRSCAGYSGRLTNVMKADRDNPYNTYRHEGLPPGPIASPGAAAIAATLKPSRHDFFFFVSDGSGKRHKFSNTLREHNVHVEAYRKR